MPMTSAYRVIVSLSLQWRWTTIMPVAQRLDWKELVSNDSAVDRIDGGGAKRLCGRRIRGRSSAMSLGVVRDLKVVSSSHHNHLLSFSGSSWSSSFNYAARSA